MSEKYILSAHGCNIPTQMAIVPNNITLYALSDSGTSISEYNMQLIIILCI